jgi:hypothetical protein
MLLPLTQQLQACAPQLLVAAAAAAPASTVTKLQDLFVSVQQVIVPSLQAVIDVHSLADVPLDASAADPVLNLLQHPAVAELLLHTLIACTAQLHQRHMAYKQQQQQQQDKQQHRADLLAIPPYHQDLLQLLPSGQAYQDAAAASFAGFSNYGSCAEQQQVWMLGSSCCSALGRILCHGFATPADRQSGPLLSAAAVRLMLELQLLAAADHQRWQQQQQQQQEEVESPAPAVAMLVTNSSRLLHILIRAVTLASSSCLPPDVLQQAGLQLLQALAAPLQQLQLGRGSRLLRYAQMLSSDAGGNLGEACHALVAAACGPARLDVHG